MSTDRELTAFVRCIGLLDNGSRPSRLRRPPRRSRFRLPQRFPRGSKTSLSRSPDVCPCPRPKRRSPRFRGGTRARSTAREMMSAPKLRWPAPAVACHTKIAAAEARLFRRNSSDQCPRQSAQNPAATGHNPNNLRRATTKGRPRAGRRRRQNSNAPSCGPVCPTPCRSAAGAPPSRRLDSTRCHCGDPVCCNGLLGSGTRPRTSDGATCFVAASISSSRKPRA
jgi:hypothetical protein